MLVANAIAEVLKKEGVKFIIGYPVNPIIEAAAEADIRTIIVRQERVGLHMAESTQLRQRYRRFCHATWPRCRKRIWWSSPGIQ